MSREPWCDSVSGHFDLANTKAQYLLAIVIDIVTAKDKSTHLFDPGNGLILLLHDMEHATPQGGSGFREGFLRHGITRSNKAGVGISYWNLMMKFRSDESAGEMSSNEDGMSTCELSF